MNIFLIILHSVLFILGIVLAVLNAKAGKREQMWLYILASILILASGVMQVCIYLKIPPPF